MASTEWTDLDEHAKALDSAFETVRDALQDEQEARENTIEARYEWGRAVQKRLDRADRGDGLAEKVADNIDKSPQYVWNHAKFYRAVRDEFEDGIDGYLQDCADFDRNLTWSAARSWAQDSDEDVDTAEQEVHEQTKRTERALERLEEEATRLQEISLRQQNELPDSQLEEVVGVLTATQQKIDDTDPDRIPDPERTRTENEGYLEWVRQHACCVCGDEEGKIDPHHLDPVGVGTKSDDVFAIPMCRYCHDRLDAVGMDEQAFFRKEGVNPYEVSTELLARLVARLDDLQSTVDAIT